MKCWSIQWKQKGQLGQSIETTQMEIEQKAHPANDAGYTKWFFNIKKFISQSVNCDNERNDVEIKMNYSIFFRSKPQRFTMQK